MVIADAPLSPAQARKGLLAVVALALLLRIVWAALIPVMPQSDVLAYDTFARNLATHGVFGWTPQEPFAFWAPGTAFAYAAAYRIGGFDYLNVVIVNLLASIVMIVCTARVAARAYGWRVALWAALVLAVWPTLVMFTTLLISELLFLGLTAAALDVWTAARGRPWQRGALAGLLLGLATLVRPHALLLPFVFAGSLVLLAGFGREALLTQLRTGVAATVVLAAVLAPWTYRNYQLYGGLVLVSTNGGVTLWMGNSPGTKGEMIPLPDSVTGMNDYQTNKVLGALAKQHIVEDIPGFVLRSARKLVLLYSNESTGALWNSGGIEARFGPGAVTPFKRFTQVSWAVIVLLAAAGAWLIARREGVWRLLASPWFVCLIVFSALHSVVLVADRYHLVMAWQIAMLAGFALASGTRFVGTRRAARSLTVHTP